MTCWFDEERREGRRRRRRSSEADERPSKYAVINITTGGENQPKLSPTVDGRGRAADDRREKQIIINYALNFL